MTEQKLKRYKFRHLRLRDRERIEQLYREGQTWLHPQVVLLGLPNAEGKLRVAIAASRKLGKAVRRNRARRLLREAVRLQQHSIAKGWDLLFIARRRMNRATLHDAKKAVREVLKQAGLWEEEDC